MAVNLKRGVISGNNARTRGEKMVLIQNMLYAILVLIIFIVLCLAFFIALALPIELVKKIREMSKNGKNN